MNGSPMRVLVVDDYDDVRELIVEILGDAGYEVFAASSGEQALEMARRSSIDMLVVDVGLPDMPGPEVARRIRTMNPDVKVLLTTGYGATDVGGEFEIAQKPFQDSDLVARVGSMLGVTASR